MGCNSLGMESLQISTAYQAPAKGASGVRVLIADDQPHVLDALQLLLKSHGYATETVTHPARVLQALQATRVRCGSDGLELHAGHDCGW